jgi:hypothetical protein
MKRRVLGTIGALAMTATALAGLTAATAVPAAAQTAPAPNANVGYIINCVGSTQPTACLLNAIRQLLQSLGLPPLPRFPFNGLTAPSSGGANSLPTVTLPASARTLLGSLPSALQTAPLATSPTISAPLRQLVPAPITSRGLATSSPLPRHKLLKANTASLPKAPSIVPIKLRNIADADPIPASSNPISSSDILVLAGLAGMATAAVVVRRRRTALS